jgi:hypothetical protein
MDKLEIKQGSFIQQTQYFILVEIDLSIVPARVGISFFHLTPNADSTDMDKLNVSWCLAVKA